MNTIERVKLLKMLPNSSWGRDGYGHSANPIYYTPPLYEYIFT